MNEVYTVDELSLGRDHDELGDEINTRLLAGDIVIGDTMSSSLDIILNDLGAEFIRKMVNDALDSQNSVPVKIKEAIKGAVAAKAWWLSHDLKKPF